MKRHRRNIVRRRSFLGLGASGLALAQGPEREERAGGLRARERSLHLAAGKLWRRSRYGQPGQRGDHRIRDSGNDVSRISRSGLRAVEGGRVAEALIVAAIEQGHLLPTACARPFLLARLYTPIE